MLDVGRNIDGVFPQTIAGLKRQLLELLSANSFVARGMRSRAVESLGRRIDGSDGVRLALQVSSRLYLSVNPELSANPRTAASACTARANPLWRAWLCPRGRLWTLDQELVRERRRLASGIHREHCVGNEEVVRV
jgi:hypothetical protein